MRSEACGWRTRRESPNLGSVLGFFQAEARDYPQTHFLEICWFPVSGWSLVVALWLFFCLSPGGVNKHPLS